MPTAKQIEKMQTAMEACGVEADLIDQAVKSVSEGEFFAAPAVLGRSAREAGLFFDNRFWPEYPKRGGGNPKHLARKKIIAAIVSGENPDLILEGVRRLKQGLASRDKIGTEFVPMAITWLNRKGWQDDPEAPPVAPTPPRPRGGGGFYAAAASIRSQE